MSMQRDVAQRTPLLVKSELPTIIYIPRAVLEHRKGNALHVLLADAGWAHRRKTTS